MPDGFHVLNVAAEIGFDIHVLTQGPMSTSGAWTQKLEWFKENVLLHVNSSNNLACPEAKITITRDKGLVYGRVLVDDWPEYILKWLTFRKRGLVIMPAREWNKDFTHEQVLRYDYQKDDLELIDRLQAAFNR